MEIELGWGTHDTGDFSVVSDDRIPEERYLKEFLAACDEYEIPITFNVVGHLLLDECDGHDGPHPDWWFENDPETDESEDPIFYWPSLIELIRERDIDHEICTHTFSHVLCHEVEPEVLDWELEKAADLHEQRGLPRSESFVPPRHQTPPGEQLAAHGLSAVRTPKQPWPSDPWKKYQRRLQSWTVDRGYTPHNPAVDDSVLETYSTPYPSLTAVHLPNGQSRPIAPFRAVPISLRQRFHRRYLEGALAKAAVGERVHLWTHLLNLANQYQWKPVDQFLQSLGQAQAAGDVAVVPMNDLADYLAGSDWYSSSGTC